LKEIEAYVLLQEQRYVGCLRLGARIELPEAERAVWEASGGDLATFRSLLGASYELVSFSALNQRVPTGILAQRYDDARRYFFLHRGMVEGYFDAAFDAGEFSGMVGGDDVINQWPDPLQQLWREAGGELADFLLAIEASGKGYYYVEALIEDTVDALQQELALDRQELQRHWDLALAARDRHLFLRALEELQIASAIANKHGLSDIMTELFNEMGNLYITFEDYPSAIEAFEEGLACEPEDVVRRVRLLTNLSQAYDLSDQPSRAIEAVETALKLIPADIYDGLLAGVYSQAATLYGEQGDHERAVQLYQLAAYLADNVPDMSDAERAMFHNNLAMAHLDRGNHDAALLQMQRCLQLDSNEHFYWGNLRRILDDLPPA
jgi:tetratricopeptide (TPR) repeat protein